MKEEGPERLDLRTMNVGDRGQFPESAMWNVRRILNEGKVVLTVVYLIQMMRGNDLNKGAWMRSDRVAEALIVRGVPTSDLVTGRPFPMKGVFRVAGTEQLESGKTVFIVEPETPEERRARLAEESLKKERQEKVRLAREKQAAELKAKEEALAHEEQKRAKMRKAEAAASGKLKLARSFLPDQPSSAIKRLQEIVNDYADTAAAKQARELLKDLGK
jgi:hypothetical protein